jgi:Subtilisin-like serine proteases
MANYVVLRDLSSVSTGGPFDGLQALGVEEARAFRMPEPQALHVAVEDIGRHEVPDLVRDPQVLAVSPSMPIKLIEPSGVEDAAAAAGDAWGVAAVGADTSQLTGQGTVVAILDTGIDKAHPAFAGVALSEVDFSGDGNGDGVGHGTHCAGTIFGRDLGGDRIGIARGVERALIGKVLDNHGSGNSEAVFSGIQWALAQGADVISMSLGFDFPGMVKQQVDNGMPTEPATSIALEAYRANLRMFDALMAQVRALEGFRSTAVVVAAAGNESRRDIEPRFEIAASLPAAAEGVVSVGALQQGGNGFLVAPFSNTFPQVSAPGVAIKSAWPGGGTRELNGTSMACPHVAGVAALWWEFARSSPVPPSVRTVIANLIASARTGVFAAGVDVVDRGAGIVSAPAST